MPPDRIVGRNKTFNSGVHIDTISGRLAPQIIIAPNKVHTSELDRKRLEPERLQVIFRHIARLLGPDNSAERQATKMFLRSFDTWSDGEQALFLATALEGLMIEKKSREDISGRLQDAVSYWIGGTRETRERNRKLVSNIYSTRSSYVHSGDEYAKAVPIGDMIGLTREVISKAILSL